MDSALFDTITRKLTTETTRRGALAGILGGATLAAGVLAVSDAEAKRRKHGKRGKGKGKGKTKVFICHRGSGSIDLIRVGSPAVKGHTKHGDTVCGTAGLCQTGEPTGCDQATGACTFAQAPAGTTCTTAGGGAGLCDAAGVCIV